MKPSSVARMFRLLSLATLMAISSGCGPKKERHVRSEENLEESSGAEDNDDDKYDDDDGPLLEDEPM